MKNFKVLFMLVTVFSASLSAEYQTKNISHSKKHNSFYGIEASIQPKESSVDGKITIILTTQNYSNNEVNPSIIIYEKARAEEAYKAFDLLKIKNEQLIKFEYFKDCSMNAFFMTAIIAGLYIYYKRSVKSTEKSE